MFLKGFYLISYQSGIYCRDDWCWCHTCAMLENYVYEGGIVDIFGGFV